MTNHSNTWIKQALQKERERRGNVCFICGTSGLVVKLDFAHVERTPISEIPRGRGRKERYYDIMKYPECYELMCSGADNCHRRYDQGLIKIVKGEDI